MPTIVVFDFDKTLTIKNYLLFDFIAEVSKNKLLIFLEESPLDIFCSGFQDENQISNDRLKLIGVYLVLKREKPFTEMQSTGKKYVQIIQLNNVHKDVFSENTQGK